MLWHNEFVNYLWFRELFVILFKHTLKQSWTIDFQDDNNHKKLESINK